MKDIVQVLARLPDVRETFRRFVFEGTLVERAVRWLMAAVIVLGLCLRARGYLFSTMAFWVDEASWAVNLMEWPITKHDIRPLGFIAVSKVLALTFGPSERVLRALPWWSGVAAVLMAPAVARRLFRSAGARLLFVAIIALHPGAIDLSKEFKQYSVSFAFHMALLLLVMRYWDSGKLRDLAVALGVALAAVFFAQDAVFAYPGVFLTLAIAALRAHRFRDLAVTAGGALLTLGVVLGMYLLIWTKMGTTEEGEKYWGKKYDVFYVQNKKNPSKTEWLETHYEQVVAMPGVRRRFWTATKLFSKDRLEELPPIDATLWFMLHVAGVWAIARRRYLPGALLVVLPLFVLTAFNVLGFWPFGNFRTNLFAVLYTAAIAAFAVDGHAERARWWDLVPAGALVLLPLFVFERNWHAKKQFYTKSAGYPQAISKLLFLQGSDYSGPPEKLVADLWGCPGWDYYVKYNPQTRELAPTLARRFQITCHRRAGDLLAEARRELQSKKRVWLLATKSDVTKMLERGWPRDLERDMRVWIGKRDHLILAVTGKPAVIEAPPPEPAEAEPEAPEDIHP